MDFHRQKYLIAQQQAKNAVNLSEKMRTKLIIDPKHISGGLLRQNFGYAQKLLQQRANDIQQIGSTVNTSTNFDTSNQGKDLYTTTQGDLSADSKDITSIFDKLYDAIDERTISKLTLEDTYKLLTLIQANGYKLGEGDLKTYIKYCRTVIRVTREYIATLNDDKKEALCTNFQRKVQQIQHYLQALLPYVHSPLKERQMASSALDKSIKSFNTRLLDEDSESDGNGSESESDSDDGSDNPHPHPDSGSDSDGGSESDGGSGSDSGDSDSGIGSESDIEEYGQHGSQYSIDPYISSTRGAEDLFTPAGFPSHHEALTGATTNSPIDTHYFSDSDEDARPYPFDIEPIDVRGGLYDSTPVYVERQLGDSRADLSTRESQMLSEGWSANTQTKYYTPRVPDAQDESIRDIIAFGRAHGFHINPTTSKEDFFYRHPALVEAYLQNSTPAPMAKLLLPEEGESESEEGQDLDSDFEEQAFDAYVQMETGDSAQSIRDQNSDLYEKLRREFHEQDEQSTDPLGHRESAEDPVYLSGFSDYVEARTGVPLEILQSSGTNARFIAQLKADFDDIRDEEIANIHSRPVNKEGMLARSDGGILDAIHEQSEDEESDYEGAEERKRDEGNPLNDVELPVEHDIRLTAGEGEGEDASEILEQYGTPIPQKEIPNYERYGVYMAPPGTSVEELLENEPPLSTKPSTGAMANYAIRRLNDFSLKYNLQPGAQQYREAIKVAVSRQPARDGLETLPERELADLFGYYNLDALRRIYKERMGRDASPVRNISRKEQFEKINAEEADLKMQASENAVSAGAPNTSEWGEPLPEHVLSRLHQLQDETHQILGDEQMAQELALADLQAIADREHPVGIAEVSAQGTSDTTEITKEARQAEITAKRLATMARKKAEREAEELRTAKAMAKHRKEQNSATKKQTRAQTEAQLKEASIAPYRNKRMTTLKSEFKLSKTRKQEYDTGYDASKDEKEQFLSFLYKHGLIAPKKV